MINTMLIEQNSNNTAIALLENSDLREIEFYNDKKASEGSVYL